MLSLYSLIESAASMGHFGAENREFLVFFPFIVEPFWKSGRPREASGSPRKLQEAPKKTLQVSRRAQKPPEGPQDAPDLKDGWRQNRSFALRSEKCVTVVKNKGSMDGVTIARSHFDR